MRGPWRELWHIEAAYQRLPRLSLRRANPNTLSAPTSLQGSLARLL